MMGFRLRLPNKSVRFLNSLPIEFVRSSLIAVFAVVALEAAASEQDIRNQIALGALAFADNCRKCHQLDGYGEEKLYPSLHDPRLMADKALLIRTILHGGAAHQDESSGAAVRLMPSLGFLTNQEIAAIIAFITNSWGDEVLLVTEQDVGDAR